VNRIRLVDAESGVLLEGTCHMWKQQELRGGQVAEILLFSLGLKDGWLELPYGFGGGGPSPPGARYSVCVVGYEETSLPEDVDPFAAGQEEVTVALQPQAGASWLEVHDAGRPADLGVLEVRSGDGAQRLFYGAASDRLRYGPFSGGDETVRVLREGRAELGVAVAGSEPEGVYSLDVTEQLGGIRVEQARAALPPLLALGPEGPGIRPRREGGTVCVFGGLPEGRYRVGPVEVIEQLRRQVDAGSTALVVEVRGGSEAVVRPPDDWILRAPLRGRVSVSNGAPMPAVVLLYSTPVQPVGKDARVLPVDASGEYTVPVGRPAPLAIAAVDVWGGQPRVRGTAWPGEDLVLAERRVRVVRGTAEAVRYVVRFRQGPGWTSVPVAPMTGDTELLLDLSAGPAELFVGRGVVEMRLTRLADGASRLVELPGKNTSEDVEVDAAASFSARSD